MSAKSVLLELAGLLELVKTLTLPPFIRACLFIRHLIVLYCTGRPMQCAQKHSEVSNSLVGAKKVHLLATVQCLLWRFAQKQRQDMNICSSRSTQGIHTYTSVPNPAWLVN